MQILKATELQDEKVTALFYAPPGMGKTTLLGSLSGKTLIVDVDRGTSVLKGKENVDIVRLSEDLSDLPEILKELQASCPYDNVCIDSLSELERGMLTYFGRIGKNDGVPEMGHYQKVDFKIMDYCRQFRDLPCNIVFTAWEYLAEVIAVSGEKYTQARPMLRDKTVNNVCGLCDIVGQVIVSTKDGEHYVRLEGTNTVVAKDRLRKRKFCRFEEVL